MRIKGKRTDCSVGLGIGNIKTTSSAFLGISGLGFANELIAEGIDCVYYDIHTSPLLAVYSDDNIISGTVCLDINRDSGGLMYPVSWLKPVDVFRNAAKYNSYIVFSNWTFDYLEKAASQEYLDDLFAELQFVRKVSYGDEELCFYRISPLLLNVEN